MFLEPATPSLAARLLRALTPARGREQAVRAIERIASDPALSLHDVRASLASLLDREETSRELAFTALLAARETLAKLDATLDRVVLAAVATDPVDALAHEISRTRDPARLDRTLAVAFESLAKPAAHARAVFIDLLRAHSLGPARASVYLHLVARDTDVRTPLADDTWLDPAARLAILGAQAARFAERGRRALLDFAGSGRTRGALARALADWPRHATHPRHVLFAFERAVGDLARAESELAAIESWALPPEVRAWLVTRVSAGPAEVFARALGPGRFECAQCGSAALHATRSRPVDPADPARGVETDYTCAACGTVHHAAWDGATLHGPRAVTPRAWIARG